ncbi:MAG: hypothetical protein IJY08_01265 [Clostridia bacterium]|nr:hypothetical protein [Clostridia bacterium]
MKKTLALFLALMTILSFALMTCNNNNNSNNTDNTEDDDGDLVVPPNSQTDNSTSGGDNSGSGTTSVPVEEWETISYTVYPIVDMNIRKGSTTGTKTPVSQSEALNAVAVKKDKNGDPDWYKLSYNGGEYYADAAYISTNIGDTKFSDLAEALTITVRSHTSDEDPYQVNLRDYPSFDSEVHVTPVKKVNTDVNPIKALKQSESGTWYYVEYNGAKYYLAVTSATKPYLDGIPGNNSGSDLPG